MNPTGGVLFDWKMEFAGTTQASGWTNIEKTFVSTVGVGKLVG